MVLPQSRLVLVFVLLFPPVVVSSPGRTVKWTIHEEWEDPVKAKRNTIDSIFSPVNEGSDSLTQYYEDDRRGVSPVKGEKRFLR